MAAAGMPCCSLKTEFCATNKRKFVAKARSLSNSKLNSRSPVSIRNIDEPIIVIDNYDSFTYNLCQCMGELERKFVVYQNDELTVEELKSPFTAGRYHSLVIEKESFPGEVLEVTARTEDGLITAARHKTYKHLQGVQFHRESIITRNFVRLIETKVAEAQN